MLLGDIIALNAGKAPDRPALVDGERELTYGQLHENATRLANALLGLAAPGDRVAILAQNVAEYVECYYGVPAAGMALTFLNYRLHPKEWAWILANAEARVLIVEQSFLDQIRPELAGVSSIEHVVVIGPSGGGPAIPYDELAATGATTPPPVEVDDDDTAWLIYTSGTTGFPKGAMLTHRGLVAAVLESVIEYQPQPDERNLLAFPLCHVAGYTVPLMHLRGGLVVLMKAYEPELFMQLVEQHTITSSALAPTMLNFLLQHPKIDDYDLSTLRNIGYGAAAMPVEVLKSAIDRFGPIVYSGFGMTELGGNVLVHSKEAHIRAINGEEHLLAACGTPMCLADVKVLDEAMRECPPGVVGEIVIQAEQVLKGYWRNDDGTKAAFDGGWFRTGDMARRDEEGFFYIVDRKKDMIVTGGENVYSREVEEVLYTHPAVSEAAVIGLPDPTWGENVTAVVVLREGMTASDAEIVATCRDQLAGYKKPKRVEFIDELPKNVSGKILKRELPRPLRALMLHIDVGLLTAQRLDGSDQSWTELYADTLAIAAEAERLGLDGVWVSEHHFTDDGYMSALLPVLAAIAARTERVTLGTNVALAPMYHPLRLAEDAAAVDLISGGRLLLGLAIGYRDAEFDAFGAAKRERVDRLVECVETCRKAWTGTPFDHDGPVVSVRDLTVRPAPPGPPEIWLGGWVDQAIERAASIADGYISPVGAVGDTRRRLEVLDEAADRVGRGLLPIATASWPSFDRGGGSSPSVERGVRHLYANYERWYSSSSDGPGGRAVGEAIAGLDAFPAGEAPPGVVTGSVQQVVDALMPLAEIGRQRTYRMALRVHYPGMARAEVFDLLAALAEEIAPGLRAAAS